MRGVYGPDYRQTFHPFLPGMVVSYSDPKTRLREEAVVISAAKSDFMLLVCPFETASHAPPQKEYFCRLLVSPINESACKSRYLRTDLPRFVHINTHEIRAVLEDGEILRLPEESIQVCLNTLSRVTAEKKFDATYERSFILSGSEKSASRYRILSTARPLPEIGSLTLVEVGPPSNREKMTFTLRAYQLGD